MAKKTLDVDTDAVVIFANKLEKIHRSALPSAVRGALNKAAFDVKTNTMPKSASQEFKKRQPNFFKVTSRFKNAIGFDIDSMESSAGFVQNKLKGSDNFAVKNLEQQEEGGTINKKSFIPTTLARTSRSVNKKVRSNARLSTIKNIVDSRKLAGKTRQARFVKSVLIAGRGGHVLGDIGSGNMILWRINSLRKTESGSFKLTALYSFEKGRSVRINKTGFMSKASKKSAKKIEDFFIIEAKRQIKKFESK